ncbi:MAG TPA: hypothetical protein H9797_01950 [Candidatus Gallimonas gallistercoris]|uniref:Protein translocase subunit SecD n=1 Tax=Candidatus Gallimonas gallistercoris TaxID=2838602 RepID=A0A9D2H1B9_9FIRM|nr:hypothetical protein [Candidatus Gallimonas gallistercoris]
MGKVKSAIVLTLITIVIAVLCVVCFVPFPCDGNGLNYFNSILGIAEKDADLGGYLIGETEYVGGGYSAVLYPEGVISGRDYENNLAASSEDEKEDYASDYQAYADGAVYLEKETVLDGENVSESFKEDFSRTVSILEERFERLHVPGASVRIADDYTVKVSLPASYSLSGAAFEYLGLMGEFTVSFGSDEASAETIIPAPRGTEHPASYYFKSISSRTASGVSYVILNMTDEGREAVAEATEGATSSYLYFKVGGETLITLTVSEQIDQSSLYISGSYDKDSSELVATVLDTAMENGTENDLALTVGEMVRDRAAYGDSALWMLYIAFGVLLVASLAFFFIRYGRLGFAHLYTLLVYLIAMTLCIWAIDFLSLGVGSVLAVLFGAIVLSVSDAMAYEYARKEFATGKTMTFAVKSGYKKCFWHIFDMHIVLAALGFIAYFIALTELSVFAFTLGIAMFFSGLATLAVGRFCWYIMMPFAKDKAKFCRFHREEVEEDD